MKPLIIALIAQLRADEAADYADLSIDELMALELGVGKWGMRCPDPQSAGYGKWTCRMAKAPATPMGRKRREDTSLGRWSPPTHVQVKVCKLSCPQGFELKGDNIAVCDMSNGYWRRQVTGQCIRHRPKCKDLVAENGRMDCSGTEYYRTCHLRCPSGWESGGAQVTFICKDGRWNGNGTCVRKTRCQIPPQNPAWHGSYTCEVKTCEVGSSHGRKRRDDELAGLDMNEIGKWGAPTNLCTVCHLKCDVMHKAKAGFRAQCRETDGVWIEPMAPHCAFGHACAWPRAGPMGEYICEHNLYKLGYSGAISSSGHRSESDRSGEFDYDYGDWELGSPYHGRDRREANETDSDGFARWGPPVIPTPPAPTVKPKPPAWWGAEWICTIRCARFHQPKNGKATAACLLRTGKWHQEPTECVYKTPCPDPKAPDHGTYQCWEETTLNINGKIHRRSAGNDTDLEDMSPNPLGRWGAPTPPQVDKSKWDFNVQKICYLKCNDCYKPSQKKSVCVNGEWQLGYGGVTHGSCIMTELCPHRPWWPIGSGQWNCNQLGARHRSCQLRCDKYHIAQPINPPLPVPEGLDPNHQEEEEGATKFASCKNKMPITNGHMACKTGDSIIDCMIMCNNGYKPSSTTLYAVCKNGMIFPGRPQKNTSWGCVKGSCDPQIYGMACYEYAQKVGRKRRDADMTDAEREEWAAMPDIYHGQEEKAKTIARWGAPTNPTSTCDNCEGYWKNQITCVFNTRCSAPSAPQNGKLKCGRVNNAAMTHVCAVGCAENYKLSPPGCKMTCNPHTGVWNKCQCVWAKTCEVPVMPNSQYHCTTENGLMTCSMVCKGNGNYIPAKYPDVFVFRCRRGEWIGQEPQGCKYEPPCIPPKLPNASLTNCKHERCLAPRLVYEEMMPGQYNYQLKQQSMSIAAAETGMSGVSSTHVGYTGSRKRRETVNGFYEGQTINLSGDDEAADRWGGSLFGRCPITRRVSGGTIHCHTIVSHDISAGKPVIIGEGGSFITSGITAPVTVTGIAGPPIGSGLVENPGMCQEKHGIENGWMECKPTGMGTEWVCMIMCNENTLPSHTNLFGNCHGGFISGHWRCIPGKCDANIYKEACWNPHYVGRRSADDEAIPAALDQLEGEEYERQVSLANEFNHARSAVNARWGMPTPPPPPPPVIEEITMCSLQCDWGYLPIGITQYQCNSETGIFNPQIQGCTKRQVTPPETGQLVWANCMICDVTCNEWHNGGGQAKCAKGYWWHIDKCTKYEMCNKPADPKHGSYECTWEDVPVGKRRRRSNDMGAEDFNAGVADYDREDPDFNRGDDYEELFLGSSQFFQDQKSKVYGSNSTERQIEEIDGMRWETVIQRKLICKLSCKEGYKPKKKTAVCVDNNWISPPSVCEKDHYVIPWTPDKSKCELPKHANKEESGKWHCKAMMLDPDTVSRSISDDDLASQDGYLLVEDDTTVSRLVDQTNFMERWHKEKDKKKAYLVCTLKCADGYKSQGGKTAKCLMKTGSWVQQATGKCVKWQPVHSECELPTKINKKLSHGKWHCKTKTVSSDRSEEDDDDYDGYVEITDESTMASVVEDSKLGERWHNSKKRLMLMCKLKCDYGYESHGSDSNNCDMKTAKWDSKFGGKCVAVWQPECKTPAPVHGGKWYCATALTDPSRQLGIPQMTEMTEGMTIRDVMDDSTTERWHNSPTLEYMLMCTLECNGKHKVEGVGTVKCDLDTGKWNNPLPFCVEDDHVDETDLGECTLPMEPAYGKYMCATRISDIYDRSEDDVDLADDEWLEITDATTLADLVKHKKKKKPTKSSLVELVCTLTCAAGFDAKPATSICNSKTGKWTKGPGKCVQQWKPECQVPEAVVGGWWQCATILTSPDQRSDELPEMTRITDGMTTSDLISSANTERWHITPTLEYTMVCQLTCLSGNMIMGSEVVKCDLNTGLWNKSMPSCVPVPTQAPELCVIPAVPSYGEWSCKTRMISSSSMRSPDHEEVAASEVDVEDEDDGYIVITEDVTITDLVKNSGEGSDRWHAGKEMYMICKLTCPAGYKLEGRSIAKCQMGTGYWSPTSLPYCRSAYYGEKMPDDGERLPAGEKMPETTTAPTTSTSYDWHGVEEVDEEVVVEESPVVQEDDSGSLSALANGETSSRPVAAEGEKHAGHGSNKKKKKDKKPKKPSSNSSDDDCDKTCQKKKKKMKKIAKKCKAKPDLKVCAKLDQDRTAAFDIIVDDYFPDFSEVCGDSRKCEKRQFRQFCVENPENLFCL